MEKRKIILFVLVGLLCSWMYVYADRIPTEGTWDNKDVRSSVSMPPEASINGNVVSIYSPDALFGLEVVIYDNVGNVIWQQTLSLGSGDVVDLPVLLEDGEYVIKMSHDRRYLIGEFEVY